MGRRRKIVERATHGGFEFDHNHNIISFNWSVIHLTPHESDILRVLLDNRCRPTSMGTLIQKVYGMREPDSAAISIRVALHHLRKKLRITGLEIRAERRLGYEINTSLMPELNQRLSDRILTALNMAKGSAEPAIAEHLAAALFLAEKSHNTQRAPERRYSDSSFATMAA